MPSTRRTLGAALLAHLRLQQPHEGRWAVPISQAGKATRAGSWEPDAATQSLVR